MINGENQNQKQTIKITKN